MAQTMTDIEIDDTEDLLIHGGDFLLTESTGQHQKQLLLNNKGDFKENPTVCVGAFNYLNDENYYGLIREVKVEFSRDGMEVREVSLSEDGAVKSDANY